MSKPENVQTSNAPAATEEKKKADPTEYMVMGKTADGTWRELGKQTAIGDKKAIEPIALKLIEAQNAEGPDKPESYSAFVAVPSRSFRPRQPKPKKPVAQLSW